MGAVRREGGKGVDAPGREVIRRDCAVEEQRRPGAPGGGATGRRVLEKRYRGIVAAYVVYGERKVANCKCMFLLKQMIAMGLRRRGRGEGGLYSIADKTHRTRMSRSPGRRCPYAGYTIEVCSGGGSQPAGVAIARDGGAVKAGQASLYMHTSGV